VSFPGFVLLVAVEAILPRVGLILGLVFLTAAVLLDDSKMREKCKEPR
jgi:hypothetical protein